MSADRVNVYLAAHDPEWAAVAQREIGRLRAVLGDNLATVEHIGSTAISSIKAKPTVDLLPIVKSLAALDAAESAIRGLGYEWRGEFGLEGRRYCTLTDPATGLRLVHLHFYEAGWPGIDRHLAFRDYLLAHADEARAYEREKMRAAALHPRDSLAYNDAKSDWIQACEVRAAVWWRNHRGEASTS
jgi:GrpB-like predicted nucleotidyltransferase (UPF0157 family)